METGTLVLVHLHSPKEKYWGALRALTLAPLVAPPYLFGLALIILGGRRGFLAQLLDVRIPLYGWPGVILAQLLSLRRRLRSGDRQVRPAV